MGIAHLEDLPADDFIGLLDLNWVAAEKLDGSYLKLGLDDQGRPYVSPHNNQIYYSLDDWPDECWTSGYRAAHLVASFFLESMIKEGAIKAGDHLGAEIINCRAPNCIEYRMPAGIDGMLWITTTNFVIPTTGYAVLESFKAEFTYHAPHSINGVDINWFEMKQRWKISLNPPFPVSDIEGMKSFADHLKIIASQYLITKNIHGYTNRDLLYLNLNKVPKDQRDALKVEREKVRDDWRSLVLLFKIHVGEHLASYLSKNSFTSVMTEGFVIQHNNLLCKITDRQNYTKLNHFVHRIKYMLVGGRRPARPSFLSRTKDWPLEKRLKRLDTLRQRYIRLYPELNHRYSLFGKTGTMFYSGNLHERMLNLFADIRKRLIDGR